MRQITIRRLNENSDNGFVDCIVPLSRESQSIDNLLKKYNRLVCIFLYKFVAMNYDDYVVLDTRKRRKSLMESFLCDQVEDAFFHPLENRY
jgi:hypothetical protein